ncbi:MAG: DNA repair protein RadA, partial [Solirubrobacterales bacterium]|nr:DNA repair protein RadA [Solirubrobacterales bacterium]
MARSATVYVCSTCGHSSARWHGQCPGCEEWNTLVEERREAAAKGSSSRAAVKPVALKDLDATEGERITTGIGELDRVLGGGLVPGSVVLIGGAPGIGKSTLTSMALGN